MFKVMERVVVYILFCCRCWGSSDRMQIDLFQTNFEAFSVTIPVQGIVALN